jgi:hypothetical protein
MERKIRIVAIEAAPGAVPVKVPDQRGRATPQWSVAKVYVLGNGIRVERAERYSTRKAAAEALAKLPQTGIRDMAALIDPAGRWCGTMLGVLGGDVGTCEGEATP